MNLGKMKAMSNQSWGEQAQKCSLLVENKGLTPMQNIEEMSRRSILNDIALVERIENHLQDLSKEIEEERIKTGRVNHQKLKVLIPSYQSAKERFYSNIEKLEQMESKMDRDILYGSHVVLKDPQARERVRNVFFKFIEIGNKKSLELENNAMNEKEEIKKMEVEHACKETNEIS